MKVVISCDGDKVSRHFGRCQRYLFLDINKNKVEDRYEVKNPGHRPGFLPRFLKSKGVEVLITGGIGPRALKMFDSYGIKVLAPISGKIEDAIDKFCKGELKEGAEPCEH